MKLSIVRISILIEFVVMSHLKIPVKKVAGMFVDLIKCNASLKILNIPEVASKMFLLYAFEYPEVRRLRFAGSAMRTKRSNYHAEWEEDSEESPAWEQNRISPEMVENLYL